MRMIKTRQPDVTLATIPSATNNIPNTSLRPQ